MTINFWEHCRDILSDNHIISIHTALLVLYWFKHGYTEFIQHPKCKKKKTWAPSHDLARFSSCYKLLIEFDTDTQTCVITETRNLIKTYLWRALNLDVGTQWTNQRGCLRVLRDAGKLQRVHFQRSCQTSNASVCHGKFTRVQTMLLQCSRRQW